MNKNDKIKNIKSIYKKDFIVETENGKTIEILTDDHTTHYDQKGNILEKKHRCWSNDQSEYTTETTSYIYDKEGKLTEKYERNGDSQHPLTDDYTYKTIYSYDDKGRLVEEDSCDKENIHPKKVSYQYDERGNKTECSIYEYSNECGEILDEMIEFVHHKICAKYDENNDMIEESHNISFRERDTSNDYDLGGTKRTIKYDDQHNKVEIIEYSKHNTTKEICKYEYNDKKEIISEYKENFNGDMLTKTTNIKYTNGNITDVVFQEYDENGSKTDIFNIKQVYDEYGNMIQQTTCVNGELIGMQRSEIEYYD